MKRLASLLIALCLCSPALAAYRSHSFNQTPGAPCVVTAPAGIQNGDVMVGFATVDRVDTALSPPGGWSGVTVTVGDANPLSMTHDNGRLYVWIKVASGESGNYTFTTDSQPFVCGIIVFSGRTSGTPTAASGLTTGATTASSPWNIDATGITAAAGDDLLFIGHSDHGNTSPNTVDYTAPSGFTKPGEFGEPGSGGSAFYDVLIAYKESVSAGATGTITGVGTLSGATAARGTFLIALPGDPPDEPATLSDATPSGTIGTATTATLGATTDTADGTLYWVVGPDGAVGTPTGNEIEAGQYSGGGTADFSGSVAVASTSPSDGVSGLTAETTYDFALVQETSAGYSNVLTGSFTTAAAGGSIVPILYHHLRTLEQ